MAKATLQYTTKDLKELGLFVEVPGRTDNEKTRQKALEEIQRRMDDPEDASLSPDSFADGLSADDLIVVEPLEIEQSEDDEPEIIQAVKAIASFASLRVSSEEAYKGAAELRPVIEALFSPEPLTPEQMQQATDKNFAKTLIKFAEAKAARDKFLPVAQEAWKVLAPALPTVSTKSTHGIDELETQATTSADSEVLPEATPNKKKSATT
ncbi:MAG TPA: hypothetical protein DCE56_27100 [Cyanobacteria bacterium UBA8553]|nr:hypothetical protein [Cyanobacteria bacterium UBA8553]HAJ59776.1 hypothetical protein [Cyanobacteria bacterium UBA8543]